MKKVVKVITVPKNIENINMVEVTEKDRAVEDGDPDDFTALESIKDDLEEGMFFYELNCFLLFFLTLVVIKLILSFYFRRPLIH